VRRLLVTAGYLAGVGATAAMIGCATGRGTTSTGAASAPAPSSAGAPTSGAVAASGHGTAISYRPVTNAGYILHRLDSLTLHLPGNAVQQQSLERTAYLHVTLAEASGSYRATIVLDSLRASASAVAVSEDSLKPVRGTRWTATLSPDGQLSNLVADRSTTLGDQLTNQLRLLFPTLPSGGARAGAVWADSVDFPLKADAFDATEHARTSYRAADDGSGLKIESTGMYTRAGTGKRFDQQMEMTASGKRKSIHRLGRNGTLVAAEGSESGDMTITVPAVGQTVPVTQTSRYDIRAASR